MATNERKIPAHEDIELQSIDLKYQDEDAVEIDKEITKDKKYDDIYSCLWHSAVQAFVFVRSLKLEFITFLYMGGYMMRSVTSVTLIMDRVCRVHIQYGEEICSNLQNYDEEKTAVEVMANNYHLGHTLIALVPSSVLSCFIGPWSDRYGRRLPLLVGLMGILFDDALSTMWAAFSTARAEYYFLPPIFSGFSGGFIAALTVIYSYASDTTPAKQRTMKYTLLEAAFGLSIPLGTFAGGMIYKHAGFIPVFGTSLVLHVCDFVFVFFLLKETMGIGNKDGWAEKIKTFFSSRNFLEGFRTALKQRPHLGKRQLWILFLAMSLSIFVQAGSSNISYMFTHHHYNWGNAKYSTVSSLFSVMTIVMMMITVPVFTKFLRLSDPMLGIIGSASLVCKEVCIALAAKEGLFYLGYLLSLLSSTANLAGRARISKIIPKADLGKVFAFLSTVESLIPIAASAAISQLFNATVGIIPDPTFTVMALCTVIMLSAFIWTYFLPKVNYEAIQEEEERRMSLASETIRNTKS